MKALYKDRNGWCHQLGGATMVVHHWDIPLLAKLFSFFVLFLFNVKITYFTYLIQQTEDTNDVPSGKRGWHRPMALEYARHWNMQQPGSGTSWRHFMQCRSLDATIGNLNPRSGTA